MAKVYLVGAGPGDPSLITMRAIQLLKKADVVLYDHLAHNSLLQYCKASAERIDVGKRKGNHSAKQSQINELLVLKAKEASIVVRLKGGDPLIFGRGGEEMSVLKEHGISYEVVPGVTSAVAVPTYAGIPLTHRELSRSVAFVTGTTLDGSSIQEKPLPDADTLVFLMAVTHLEELCEKLLKRERFTEKTPAALIHKGTTADQKVVLGTLADIHIKKKTENILPPSILVVGEVAALSESLDWWHQRPLSGRRVALLREKSKSQDVVDTLEHLGAEVMVCPMLVVKPEAAAQRQLTSSLLNDVTDLIFTSQNGVDTFFETLYENGLDARSLAGKNIVAVGPKTAKKCVQYGIQADAIPDTFQADAIPSVLDDNLSGRHLLFPVGKKVRPSLPEACKNKGADCTVLNIYDTHMPVSPQLSLRDGDDVVFTSPSIVNHAIESGVWTTQNIQAFSIGPVTTKALQESGKRVDIVEAKEFTMDGVLDAITNSSQLEN